MDIIIYTCMECGKESENTNENCCVYCGSPDIDNEGDNNE